MANIGSGGVDFIKAGREETIRQMETLMKTRGDHEAKIAQINVALEEMGETMNDLDKLAKIAGIDLNAETNP